MINFDKEKLRLAIIQTTSASTVAGNLLALEAILDKVDEENVDLVCLAEGSNLIQSNPVKFAKEISRNKQNTFIDHCRRRALQGNYWLHTGSIAVQDEDKGHLLNRSLVFDNLGDLVCQYDKIHLFDVDLGDGLAHRESDRYRPGNRAVLCHSPWGDWGMSICYDIRFPHLYRAYAQAGANILFIPAAFTTQTGRLHWQVLLRCRAIENGCYVVAAAQCGQHEDGRETYGHSMVIDPWGEVLADGGIEPGIIYASLDLSLVQKNRRSIPSLKNERTFLPPITGAS